MSAELVGLIFETMDPVNAAMLVLIWLRLDRRIGKVESAIIRLHPGIIAVPDGGDTDKAAEAEGAP